MTRCLPSKCRTMISDRDLATWQFLEKRKCHKIRVNLGIHKWVITRYSYHLLVRGITGARFACFVQWRVRKPYAVRCPFYCLPSFLFKDIQGKNEWYPKYTDAASVVYGVESKCWIEETDDVTCIKYTDGFRFICCPDFRCLTSWRRQEIVCYNYIKPACLKYHRPSPGSSATERTV